MAKNTAVVAHSKFCSTSMHEYKIFSSFFFPSTHSVIHCTQFYEQREFRNFYQLKVRSFEKILFHFINFPKQTLSNKYRSILYD